jgi:hypothetical protein
LSESRFSHFVTLSVTLIGAVAALFVISSSSTTSTVLAEEPLQSTRESTTVPASNAAEQLTTFKCMPIEVYVSTQQIRVKCSTAFRGIVYFSTPAKDPPNARNFLLLMTEAFTTRKPLNIDFMMSDISGEEYGCKKEDCRLIDGAALVLQ